VLEAIGADLVDAAVPAWLDWGQERKRRIGIEAHLRDGLAGIEGIGGAQRAFALVAPCGVIVERAQHQELVQRADLAGPAAEQGAPASGALT
jgi:hypothetical protein